MYELPDDVYKAMAAYTVTVSAESNALVRVYWDELAGEIKTEMIPLSDIYLEPEPEPESFWIKAAFWIREILCWVCGLFLMAMTVYGFWWFFTVCARGC
jgi:hypothetical protein